jgi:hypothetical protein
MCRPSGWPTLRETNRVAARRRCALGVPKKRGNGDIASPTVEILQGIRADLGGLRQEIVQLREETTPGVAQLREEHRRDLEALEHATIRGFEGVARRLDDLIDISGDRYRDHEARIVRLEERMERVDPPR